MTTIMKNIGCNKSSLTFSISPDRPFQLSVIYSLLPNKNRRLSDIHITSKQRSVYNNTETEIGIAN